MKQISLLKTENYCDVANNSIFSVQFHGTCLISGNEMDAIYTCLAANCV